MLLGSDFRDGEREGDSMTTQRRPNGQVRTATQQRLPPPYCGCDADHSTADPQTTVSDNLISSKDPLYDHDITFKT